MENSFIKASRPISKILVVLSMLASIAAVTVLVMFNFADVFTIFTDESTKYAAGFSYPGYQAIFSGYGIQIIQGYSEAGFNIWMFLAFFLPLVACIVSFFMLLANFLTRGTNKKKAIVDIIAAVLLIVGGIMLFSVDKFWIEAAKNVTGSYANYYELYLLPAINGELYFGKDTFPSVVLVVCLIAGIIKLASASFLLVQKYYARSLSSKQGNAQ